MYIFRKNEWIAKPKGVQGPLFYPLKYDGMNFYFWLIDVKYHNSIRPAHELCVRAVCYFEWKKSLFHFSYKQWNIVFLLQNAYRERDSNIVRVERIFSQIYEVGGLVNVKYLAPKAMHAPYTVMLLPRLPVGHNMFYGHFLHNCF